MFGALDKTFIWAVKYPFDKKSIELLSSLEISLEEILSDESFLEEARKKLKYILKEGKLIPTVSQNPYRDFVIFYIQVLLVRALGHTYIERRFIEVYSKFSSSFLSREDEGNVEELAKNLGLSAELLNIDGNLYFGVPFYEFFKLSKKLSDKYWKLYYFPLHKGYVLLNRKNFVRLLQEAIKVRLFEILLSVENVPEEISEVAQKLLKEVEEFIPKTRRRQEGDFITRDIENYPPCIKYLLANIGKGLGHSARFTLVAFLNTMGYSKDEIIQMFNVTPDFNERMTRYQVEHILGLRGGKTRYSVPSCRKIVSYGFCKADDICKKYTILHPLKYVYVKKRYRE